MDGASGAGGRGPRGGRSRVSDLLSIYYTNVGEDDGARTDHGDTANIDGVSFQSDAYMTKLLRDHSLQTLVNTNNTLTAEIKGLDGDLQMLVYENYNKFISASDTIRTMQDKVSTIETELTTLQQLMQEISGDSDTINDHLAESRAKIEQLNAVRGLVKKLQFVFELPTKLNRSVACEAFSQAVRYYAAANAILEANSNIPSFASIRDEAEDIMHRLRAQMRDQARHPDVPLAALTELTGLLLRLDEDDYALRTLFVARWTKEIDSSTAQILGGSAASGLGSGGDGNGAVAGEGDEGSAGTSGGGGGEEEDVTAATIKALNQVTLRHAVRFAGDFSDLFVNNSDVDIHPDDAAEAREQVEELSLRFLNTYLDAFDECLRAADTDVATTVAYLKQVENNCRGLAQLVPSSAALAERHATFAHGVVTRQAAVCTAEAAALLEHGVDQLRGAAAEVYGRRAGGEKYECASMFASLVTRLTTDTTAVVSEMCDGLDMLLESTTGDSAMFAMTAGIIGAQVGRLHDGLHAALLAMGGHASLKPFFGVALRQPRPIERHALGVLLAAAAAQRIMEGDVWAPFRAIVERFPAAERAKAEVTFSRVAMSDLWTKTARLLLHTLADWAAMAELPALRAGFAASWRHTVGGAGEGRALVVGEYTTGLLNRLWQLQQDVLGTFGAARSLPDPSAVRVTTEDARLCCVRGKSALIAKDIDRMFSDSGSKSAGPTRVTPASVPSFTIQAIVRSATELVRGETRRIDLTGLHQLQVDVRALRWGVRLLCEEPDELDGCLDEMLMSASDRCVAPSAADQAVVDAAVHAAQARLDFVTPE